MDVSKQFSATIFKVNFCLITQRHNADGPLQVKINRWIAIPEYSYMNTGREAPEMGVRVVKMLQIRVY
jgi:hypothetical protein